MMTLRWALPGGNGALRTRPFSLQAPPHQLADQASGDSVDSASSAAWMRDAFKEVDDDTYSGDVRNALAPGRPFARQHRSFAGELVGGL